jgi:hypothetical protein
VQRVVTRVCAVAVVCAAGVAYAGNVTLDNNVVGIGHLDITVDDYGSYGRDIGPSSTDNFWPPNYQRADTQTFAAENFMFIGAGTPRGAVGLSASSILWKLVEGNNQATGIGGTYSGLQRNLVTGITKTGNIAHSVFTITDTASGVSLNVALDQQIVNGINPATVLQQDYTITNMGVQVPIIFHALWDMNLYFLSTDANDDIVGVGTGTCYVYMHDPGSSTQSGALADGGSTVNGLKLPMSAYYGGKDGLMPEGTLTPAFTTAAATPVWTSFGMPQTWKNELVSVGKNMPGESSVLGNGTIGIEWQFLLTNGQFATIRVHRNYGTTAVPCATVGVNCGNGTVDPPDESCDTMLTDTMTCNGNTCSTASCGDGYVNMAAGETCESNKIDTADCNGTRCTTPACGDGYVNTAAGEMCDDGADTANCNLMNCMPPVCGDGIINEAAGEECDSNELCTDCKVAFSLGGGCAGCAAPGGGGGSVLLAGFVALTLRRRRRARRA